MKRFVVVRHAKSSWSDPGLLDIERPLNKRGRRSAPRMADRLKELGVEPDLILSSPATRALATARTMADRLGSAEGGIRIVDAIYGAGSGELLDLIRSMDDPVSSLMLVGHNPASTDLANRLADAGIDNIPTCGAFCADFDVSSWSGIGEGSGRVVFFEFPKKLDPE
jgi:phosphohistidine phosphatase